MRIRSKKQVKVVYARELGELEEKMNKELARMVEQEVMDMEIMNPG